MDLKEEEILGSAIAGHWYYVAKGRAMRKFLGGFKADEVLDVGAGSGVFSRQLLDAGICNSATCIDPNYASEREEVHNGKTLRFLRDIRQASQKLVLMMDVLEHVDNDAALLSRYAGMMPKGGRVLITVPAFQFLWSGHDIFLEHRRRYTGAQLENTVKKAGLRVIKTRYFFGILFPLIAAIRLSRAKASKPKSDLKIYPGWLNCALISLHDVERAMLFPWNRIAGLSVFCLCEKV